MLLDTQYNSRLNGIKDIGCTWMKLASEIDLQKQKRRKKRKSNNIITSEQHIRQLISQIRKKAKEATKDANFNLINEAVKGRYILNEKTTLFQVKNNTEFMLFRKEFMILRNIHSFLRLFNGVEFMI